MWPKWVKSSLETGFERHCNGQEGLDKRHVIQATPRFSQVDLIGFTAHVALEPGLRQPTLRSGLGMDFQALLSRFDS